MKPWRGLDSLSRFGNIGTRLNHSGASGTPHCGFENCQLSIGSAVADAGCAAASRVCDHVFRSDFRGGFLAEVYLQVSLSGLQAVHALFTILTIRQIGIPKIRAGHDR
jgi:hypothetical protein